MSPAGRRRPARTTRPRRVARSRRGRHGAAGGAGAAHARSSGWRSCCTTCSRCRSTRSPTALGTHRRRRPASSPRGPAARSPTARPGTPPTPAEQRRVLDAFLAATEHRRPRRAARGARARRGRSSATAAAYFPAARQPVVGAAAGGPVRARPVPADAGRTAATLRTEVVAVNGGLGVLVRGGLPGRPAVPLGDVVRDRRRPDHRHLQPAQPGEADPACRRSTATAGRRAVPAASQTTSASHLRYAVANGSVPSPSASKSQLRRGLGARRPRRRGSRSGPGARRTRPRRAAPPRRCRGGGPRRGRGRPGARCRRASGPGW